MATSSAPAASRTLAMIPEDDLANLTHAITGKRMNRIRKRTKEGLVEWLSRNPAPRQAVDIIARAFNFSLDDLLRHTRTSHVVKIRIGAMYVLRRFELSLPEIGIVFDRDHSTILYDLTIAEKWFTNSYYKIANRLNELTTELKPLLSIYINRPLVNRHNLNERRLKQLAQCNPLTVREWLSTRNNA